MTTLQLICVVLFAGAALAKPSNPDALTLYTRVFTQPNQGGTYKDVYDYVPDLYNSGVDNDIDSVHQTGLWIYYENNNYNDGTGGRVYFVHGIELSMNFPGDYVNMMTSMRFAGDKTRPNGDTFTLYDGQYFAANEFYGVTDAASLDYLDLAASSAILTGQSPWTFYTDQSFSGMGVCVYPNTDHDVGPQGDTLDFGIYPTISTIGIADNAVRSVRKGCWSDKVAAPSNVKYEVKAKNGGWGFADL